MPLGVMNILPFLKGWGYTVYRIPLTTITRGAAPVEKLRVDEEGLLLLLILAGTDAYATLALDFQGADLQPYSVSMSPEAARTVGAWQQDPAGFLQRYYRPLPASTAGVYYVVGLSGFQGLLLPYYRSVVGKVSLGSDSTETSASIAVNAYAIRFTDKKAFIRTYRKFMGIKETEIDAELLEVGPR